MSDRPIAEIMADPAGDLISPRIQYLEQWIRDCQRYNRNVSAQLTGTYDRIRDLESLLAAKNAELRKGADRLAELEAEKRDLRQLVDVDDALLAHIDALRPPCPNPSHSIECPWTYNDGMESYIYRCSKPCGHPGDHRSNGTYPVGWDSDALGARLVICPDCIDGKVSIERMAALWNFVQTASDANLWSIEYLRTVKP